MYIVSRPHGRHGLRRGRQRRRSGTALVMELARILNAPGVDDRSQHPLRAVEQRGDRPERRHRLRQPAQGLAGHRVAQGLGPLSGTALAGHDPARHDDVRSRHAGGAHGKPPTARRSRPAAGAAPRSRRQHRVPGELETGRGRAKAGLGLPRRQRQVRDRLSGRRRPAHDEHGLDPVHGPGAVDFAARERARPADRRRLEPALAPADRPGTPPSATRITCWG
jgi:hypothetical protein